jgi:serine/threonine-protein kinase
MGEVWKGYDIELNRTVAIKALRGDMTNEEAKLRRLRAEAHNSANLAHPNIAALFEYYEHDGIGFLIMEYVPSKSLAEIFQDTGANGCHRPPAYSDPDGARTVRGALARSDSQGCETGEHHGLGHRREVKITDFGVSYSTNQGQITQDGMVVGTAQYISPEQAQGLKATPQSDIYSLGVVAYEGLMRP